MTNFLTRLSVYEQLGYLLVGILALFLSWVDLTLIGRADWARGIQTAPVVVTLLAAFVLGHVLQAVANLVLRHPKNPFAPSQKEILAKASDYFGLTKQSDGELWMLCYAKALANDFTGQVNAFNAYYGLYRGWAVALFVEFLVLGEVAVVTRSLMLAACALFSALAGVLFTRRSYRFYANLTSKALHTFVIIMKNEASNAGTS